MIKNEYDTAGLTRVIKKEEAKWKNGTLNETSPDAYPMLKAYWDNLGIEQSKEQMSDNSHQNTWPWSAAYISYVITRVDNTFPKSSAHRNYFEVAKKNRNNNNNSSGLYKAYSLSREKEPILSQVGDVLGKPRSGSYTNTHSDVVYEVIGNVAKLSGGNLGDSNKTNMSISLNPDGSYPTNPNNYIVVIKKM